LNILQKAVLTLQNVRFAFRGQVYAGFSEEEVIEIKKAEKVVKSYIDLRVDECTDENRFLYLSEEPVSYTKVGWDEIGANESTNDSLLRLRAEKNTLADKLMESFKIVDKRILKELE